MTFRSSPTGTTKKSSLFLYSICIELYFVLNASRFDPPLLYLANGPLTNIHQASAFIAKSDVSLHSSDRFALSTDALLGCGDPEPFEGPNNSPLDSDETAFTDLFTETEFSQDTVNVVCGCLIPAAHLTRNLGCVPCNSHTYGPPPAADILML